MSAHVKEHAVGGEAVDLAVGLGIFSEPGLSHLSAQFSRRTAEICGSS